MSFLAWKYFAYGHLINKTISSLAFLYTLIKIVKTLLLAAETTETRTRLGINSGNSFLNRNESKIQRTLYKNDDIFAVLDNKTIGTFV